MCSSHWSHKKLYSCLWKAFIELQSWRIILCSMWCLQWSTQPKLKQVKAELKSFYSNGNGNPEFQISEMSQEPRPVSRDCIYPALVGCSTPVEAVLPQISSNMWWVQNTDDERTDVSYLVMYFSFLNMLIPKNSPHRSRGFGQLVRARNIKTVGDLSALTPSEIKTLPIRSPKISNVKKALKIYEQQVCQQGEGWSGLRSHSTNTNDLTKIYNDGILFFFLIWHLNNSPLA